MHKKSPSNRKPKSINSQFLLRRLPLHGSEKLIEKMKEFFWIGLNFNSKN